jgi:dihydrodipicolinate synthase/N-acetylneuraminate lyase
MKRFFTCITPFVEDGSAVDTRSLERLIAFDFGLGLDGFFFFGSMGECSSLERERG